MIAYRIDKKRFSRRRDVLSGEGARRYGGRWNRTGLPLVYASQTSSLALLEKLTQASPEVLPASLVLITIRIPDGARVFKIEESRLPVTWREPGSGVCLTLGSEWCNRRDSLVLRVPSAANPYEDSIILNPLHPDIEHCSVSSPVPARFDARIWANITR